MSRTELHVPQVCRNLITLVEELGYGGMESKQQIMKLRENVNYSVYVKDYWMISYGHPQLDETRNPVTRNASQSFPDLPSPPTEKKETSEENISKKTVKTTVEIHQKETSAVGKKKKKKRNRNLSDV